MFVGNAGFRFGWAALAVALLAMTAVAQDMPSGAELMDKSAKASGGEEVLEGLENVTVKGTITIQNVGMGGDVSIYMVRPNKGYMVFEIPGLEKLQRGWDGEIGWETSIIQGPRVLEGGELASFLRDIDFEAQIDWRKMYKSAETTGETEVDGEPCWIVELVTHSDEEMMLNLDKETYLPASMSLIAESPYGEIPVTLRFKDYKDFKGMIMAAVTETEAAGQVMVLTINSVDINEELDDALFEIPADVQALLDANEAEAPAP
jgi:hypothetical protein